MKKNTLLITLAFVALLALVLLLIKYNTSDTLLTQSVETTTDDPIDSALEFYNKWLDATLSTTTDPVQAGLLDQPVVSQAVRSYIEAGDITLGTITLNPVFCQNVIPDRFGAKILFATESNAQIIVLARGLEEKSPFQAIVTLEAKDSKWQMSEIKCSQGEVAPEREYDFERAGFILKSVPPPLNSDLWHLVYEENGIMGHTVPLTFTEASVCISTDGIEGLCDESTFTEATPATLQADMTESGAIVRRLQF